MNRKLNLEPNFLEDKEMSNTKFPGQKNRTNQKTSLIGEHVRNKYHAKMRIRTLDLKI